MEPKKMTEEEWRAEGVRRFGDDTSQWRFVCPSCGYVASVQEWKDAGATEGTVGFSCVGRYIDGNKKEMMDKTGGPCNYAGGGLIGLNPVEVVTEKGKFINMFDFAPEEVTDGQTESD